MEPYSISTCLTVTGLAFDVVGAALLIWGELKGRAGGLNYRATEGTMQEIAHFWRDVNNLPLLKRIPVKLGAKLGSRTTMGQNYIFDSFPFTAWGIFLLIIGFGMQGIGALL